MNERHRLIIGLLKLFDLSLVVLAFGIATVLVVKEQHGIDLAQFLSMRTRVVNLLIVALALYLCHVIMCVCRLYQSRRLLGQWSEIADLAKAATLNTICLGILHLIFSIRMMSTAFLATFWIANAVLMIGGRLLLRSIAVYFRRHGRNLRYILILGTNDRAISFANTILADPDRGYRLLGFVDDEWAGLPAFHQSGYKVVSDYANLAEYLRRNVVDEVAIYLPFRSYYPYSSQVASLCAEHGITMGFHSDIFGLKTARFRTEQMHGDHYVTTYTGISELWPQAAKRAIDIIGSGFALLLLAPVLIVTAIAIKLTSPGPVFFLQERVGVNKRRFKIFKFRTMVPNAEALMAKLEAHNEAGGPTFKMKNDPRITPIGKFLRRTSIDELPQFINVLKGDMSLVGPRPLPVRDFEGFNEDWQRRRFSVKPGITCLWQVNGRSGITFDQWMKLDLKYMDEWSLWLDFKILAKTVPAVLKGQGAV